MRTHFLIPAALLALALAGCTPPAQPMPESISVPQLAQLLGGELMERDTSAEEEFLMAEDDHARVVAIRLFVKLGQDRAAVVARSQSVHGSGKERERNNSHASGGDLDLVYLRWQGRRWIVDRHYAAALQLGSSGEFGHAESVDLARGPQGLKGVLIHSGGTWQGLSMDSVDLIPLDGKAPRSVLSQPVASDNQGACDAEQDCWSAVSVVRLQPDAAPGKMAAVRIEQTLESEPSPLKQPAFRELGAEDREALRRRHESATPPPREQTTTRGAMIFEWDGSRYQLRSGRNMVPEI